MYKVKYKKIMQMVLGFTLVELSIVIIIIGFLIAGITAGTSLINVAKLNSTITIQRQLQTAIQLFKSRYDSFPGDFPNASAYWPSANCTVGDTNKNKANCDGNNDGVIGGDVGSANATAEGSRVPQHLASAGLINGNNYVGGSPSLLLGINAIPIPLYTDAGYNIDNRGSGNLIMLTARISNTQPGGSTISSKDAFYIDNKIDDGRPSTGSVISYGGYNPTASCTSTDANNNVVYNVVIDSRKMCVMAHKIPDQY
jgi:type II secretory pathway pseudopilin PulG